MERVCIAPLPATKKLQQRQKISSLVSASSEDYANVDKVCVKVDHHIDCRCFHPSSSLRLSSIARTKDAKLPTSGRTMHLDCQRRMGSSRLTLLIYISLYHPDNDLQTMVNRSQL